MEPPLDAPLGALLTLEVFMVSCLASTLLLAREMLGQVLPLCVGGHIAVEKLVKAVTSKTSSELSDTFLQWSMSVFSQPEPSVLLHVGLSCAHLRDRLEQQHKLKLKRISSLAIGVT